MGEFSPIVFIIGGLSRGGIETHLVDVAERLHKERVKLSIILLFDQGPLLDRLIVAGIEVIYPEKPISGRLRIQNIISSEVVGHLFRCYKFLRKRNPVIVHTFLPSNTIVGWVLAKCAKVDVIISSRVSRNFYQRDQPVVFFLEKWINKRLSAVTGNSKSVVEDLSREGLTTNKLRLIYTGIDVDNFSNGDRSRARKRLGIDENQLLFINVANLIPYKGHQDLLLALRSIQTKIPEKWTLLVIGRDDGIGSELARLATNYGLDGRVEFLGSRNDVPELMAAGDIGLLTSHTEGFSNAVLESMAAGLPMVVTDVGGNKEAVNETSGFVLPSGDVEGISEAILILSKDPILRDRLGKLGQARVRRLFSIDKTIDEYFRLYRECMASVHR